jgi:hypothetical protein
MDLRMGRQMGGVFDLCELMARWEAEPLGCKEYRLKRAFILSRFAAAFHQRRHSAHGGMGASRTGACLGRQQSRQGQQKDLVSQGGMLVPEITAHKEQFVENTHRAMFITQMWKKREVLKLVFPPHSLFTPDLCSPSPWADSKCSLPDLQDD